MKIMTTRRSWPATPVSLLALAATLPAWAEKAKFSGQATYYEYAGGGNCMLPVPADRLTAAINAPQYQGAKACGGKVQVKNTDTGQTVTLRIHDQCPNCASGDLDLSREAFEQIAPLGQGIAPITWKYVPDNEPASIQLFIANGSSAYYTAVQVRDHRYRIAKLQYRPTGQSGWTAVDRADYNYFIKVDGMGPGPYDFRITDVNQQVVVAKNVPLVVNVEWDTGLQFPK